MAKYYYNGVLLPEIPADVLAEYPYAVITRMDSYSRYDVYLSAGAWYLSGNDIKNDVTESEPICRLEDGKSEWTQISPADYVIFIPTNAVVWSNHDIPNGSATATEIYFYGSDPVPEETDEPEEPETVTQYLIRSDTLTAIADRTREMAGTNKKMTPADIIYWLWRVKFIPQGWATSEFTLDFDSGASGVLPTVVKGTASSEFTLNFESSAVGALQEG